MVPILIDPENDISCVSIKNPAALFEAIQIFLYNFFNKVGFDRVDKVHSRVKSKKFCLQNYDSTKIGYDHLEKSKYKSFVTKVGKQIDISS